MDKGEFEILVNALRQALVEEDQEEEEQEGGIGNLYYNPDVFMGLHSIDYKGLRKLITPDLSRLRRIQGI